MLTRKSISVQSANKKGKKNLRKRAGKAYYADALTKVCNDILEHKGIPKAKVSN